MMNGSSLLIEKMETVLVRVNGTGTSFNFSQNQENIERGEVEGIICYSVNEIPLCPDGSPTVNNTVFNKAYLDLTVDSDTKINRIPLKFFNVKENNGEVRFVKDFKINFPKCKIVLADNTGVVPGESFIFGFIYKTKK